MAGNIHADDGTDASLWGGRVNDSTKLQTRLNAYSYVDETGLTMRGVGNDTLGTVDGYSNDALGGFLRFRKSRSTTVGPRTIVHSSDILGNLSWSGADGSVFVEAARIQAASVGTISSGIVPGVLIASTDPTDPQGTS